jgi:hypothetical protein
MRTVLYGTGTAAENIVKNLSSKFQVIAVCDGDKAKQGKMYHGFTIVHLDDISDLDFEIVLICSQYHIEIKANLYKLGIPAEKIMTATITMRQGHAGEPAIFGKSLPYEYVPRLTRQQDLYQHLCLGVEYTYSAGVEGDIAEFGCGSGVSTHALANAILQCDNAYAAKLHKASRKRKELHLFDSFEGLPSAESETDKITPDVVNNSWAAGQCFDFDAKALQYALANELAFEHAHFYIGWYADTLKTIDSTTLFSFVHLDCDLYQSTFEVLHYLMTHKHLAKGCLLYFDDWSTNHSSNDFGQRKAWLEILQTFHVDWDNFGFYGNGCKKIIIHGYSETKKSLG